jgi:anti-sigma regulatory factor (Ser/Thr protein kinase)
MMNESNGSVLNAGENAIAGGVRGERTWPASLDCLEEMRAFVMEIAEDGTLPPRRLSHLDLALEEIVVNICSYAYQTPPGEVTIRIEDTPGSFSVEFVDNGVPFDPLALEDPDVSRPLMEREAGGLGILLVRRTMDEVHYARRGNLNCLKIVVTKPE